MAEVQPTEILLNIFNNLTGDDIVSCRAVCRRWKAVIDNLPDDIWRKFCQNDFEISQSAYEKARISWRELYRSLKLWAKLPTATMTVKNLPIYDTNHLKVLKNSIVAVLQNYSGDIVSSICGYSDTIIYYDLDTMQKCGQENFNFLFGKYDENNQLIVLEHRDGRLCVIPKATKERHFVGKLPRYASGRFGEFTLFDTEVYFKTETDMITVSRIEEKDGRVTITTEDLEDFEEHIVAFHYVNDKQINILTDEGNIYLYKDKDFETASMIDGYCDVIYELKYYGFDWSSLAIYQWLIAAFGEEHLHITKYKNATIYKHGKVILLGTSRGTIHIYYNPYSPYSELIMYNMKPIKTVDITKLFKTDWIYKEIQQFEVVETCNGHKIIVLIGDKLYLMEFVHENKKEPVKRKQKEVKIVRKKAKVTEKADVKTKKSKVNEIAGPSSSTRRKTKVISTKTKKKATKKSERLKNVPVHRMTLRSKKRL